MKRESKIDKVKLYQLLADGKTVREVAKYFKVSPGRISQVRKGLSIPVIRSVALEHAHEVVSQNLNAVEQLQKINSHANEILDLLMRWNRGDKTALQILESQVRKVRVRGSEEEITEYRLKDPRELALKAMGEIRCQLELQLEIFKTLYDVQAIAEFQSEVLSAIQEVDDDTRRKIVFRLKQTSALRRSLDIHP